MHAGKAPGRAHAAAMIMLACTGTSSTGKLPECGDALTQIQCKKLTRSSQTGLTCRWRQNARVCQDDLVGVWCHSTSPSVQQSIHVHGQDIDCITHALPSIVDHDTTHVRGAHPGVCAAVGQLPPARVASPVDLPLCVVR